MNNTFCVKTYEWLKLDKMVFHMALFILNVFKSLSLFACERFSLLGKLKIGAREVNDSSHRFVSSVVPKQAI